MNLTLLEREQRLLGRYSLIEDRHERLGAIIGHRLPGQELSEIERNDADLVRGCVSRVWLRLAISNEMLEIRYAAEASTVRGMVALLATLYQGCAIDEAAVFRPHLLENLGLTRMLSSTRLTGFEKVTQAIRGAAMQHVERRGLHDRSVN